MTHAKKLFAVLVAMIVPFVAVASAQAAGETVNATANLAPLKGSFFKEKSVPSNLKIEAVVTPAASSAMVNPTKNIKFTFPAGMTFNSNNKICPDSKIGPSTNLAAGPKYMVDQCRDSIVGTGTAVIYLAKQKSLPLSDPVLIAFNAGKDNQGRSKLKIYGYSKQTTVGILINGTLKGRVLDLAIPVLSADSAVGDFRLEIPGPVLNRPDLDINIRGLDSNYVQARCASSPLVTNAVFELGERDVSTNEPTTPTVTVDSPQTTQNCTGAAGKARLGVARVAGPNAVRNGRKGTFRVTVRNTGTATAKRVTLTTNRGGRGNGGNIAPGASKVIVVKPTIRGKRGRSVSVRFNVKAGNVKAAANKRVRVR